MTFRTVIGLVFVLAVLLAGQQEITPDSLPPTGLRTRPPDLPEPKLVNLNVIALDNHGQPVNNLTSDDFEVSDAGKPQTIAFFRHNDSKVTEAPPVGPNEFSNRVGAEIPHATIILFDLLNEGFGTRSVAANQLVKELQSLETADYLYLYFLTVDGHLYPVHGVEGEERETRQPGQGPAGEQWTRQIKPLMDAAMRSVMKIRPIEIDVAVRVQLTYNALAALGMELSSIPGRKNIVWISDGVPIALGPVRSDTGDYVDFTPLLRKLSEELDRFGISIYPVRQVMLGSPDGIGATSGAGQTGGAGIGIQSIETLNQFAAMTGGRPNEGKDIGAAVKRAMNDLDFSYQIGYFAQQKNWDNKFHKLRITCKRKGVRLQTKTGYYAWNDPPGSETREAINAAISTPFDATEIGLRGTMTPEPKQAGPVHFEVRIDARDIGLGREGDQYTGQLRLEVVGYRADGRSEGSAIMPLDLHYSAQERDKALKDGVTFPFTVPIAQMSKVRLIVFDRGSNSIGSLTIPVNASGAQSRP